jgi:hypothetical protein
MSTFKRRLAGIAVLVTSGLLLLPAAGQAAQVFGSRFTNNPANSAECENIDPTKPCTIVAYNEPSEPNGDPYTGGAPSNGIITQFRIKARVENNPAPVTFLLASLEPFFDPGDPKPKSANAALATVGPTVTLHATDAEEGTGTGDTPVQAFPARVPVVKGQQLGISSTAAVQATHVDNGDANSFAYPALTAKNLLSEMPSGELLVQATVEPDVDGDGFGDGTQDQCPSQKTTQGPCDLAPPMVSAFRVRKGKASYTLSEASTVSLQLTRKKPHSRKFKPFGPAFAGPGALGANSVVLPRRSKNKPGIYRLTLTATDAVGNSGATTTTFRVVLRARAFS